MRDVRRPFAALTFLILFSLWSLSQERKPDSSPSGTVIEGIRVEGTRVTLAPPPGFVPASAFAGFEEPRTSSRIAVFELPGPAPEVIAGYSEEAMKEHHMAVQTRESVTVDGMPGLLVYALNETYGTSADVVMGQWALVFGNSKGTVTIVAYFPLRMASTLAKPLRDSLLSTKWQPEGTIDPMAGLPFEVKETASLKFKRRNGAMVMYTSPEGGSRSGPLFFVAGLDKMAIEPSDRKQFCEATLSQNPDKFGQILVESNNATTIGGLSGCEVHATATQVEGGARVFFFQVLLFDGERVFLAFGMVGVAERDKYLGQFREMAASIKVK